MRDPNALPTQQIQPSQTPSAHGDYYEPANGRGGDTDPAFLHSVSKLQYARRTGRCQVPRQRRSGSDPSGRMVAYDPSGRSVPGRQSERSATMAELQSAFLRCGFPARDPGPSPRPGEIPPHRHYARWPGGSRGKLHRTPKLLSHARRCERLQRRSTAIRRRSTHPASVRYFTFCGFVGC